MSKRSASPAPASAPTPEQTIAYQAMYDYFNAELFGGQLPAVLLNFSRLRRTLGFFAFERWERGAQRTHEISLNPAYLKERSAEEVVSTLVHEMAHLWQFEFGNPSRAGYHNHEWAAKMETIGLISSDTGQPGGRRVGQHMSHYIAAGGLFQRAFERMPRAFRLPWTALPEAERGRGGGAPPARNKVKYSCPSCGVNVWGRPGLNLVCGDDDSVFEASE